MLTSYTLEKILLLNPVGGKKSLSNGRIGRFNILGKSYATHSHHVEGIKTMTGKDSHVLQLVNASHSLFEILSHSKTPATPKKGKDKEFLSKNLILLGMRAVFRSRDSYEAQVYKCEM